MTDVIEQDTTRFDGKASAAATWVRLSRIGAVAALVWSIVLQIIIGAFVPPIAIPGLIFGVLALFLTGERRKLAATTGVLALLAIVGNLPGTVDELSHPSSGVAFSTTLFITLAALVCFVAGLGAAMKWNAPPVRSVLVSAGAIFAAGVAFAVAASAGVSSTDALPDDVTVVAELNQFEPEEIVVAAGETGFWLDNRDGIRHTLSLEGSDVEIDAPGYSSQRAVFDLDPGRYAFFCAVSGHENMRIDLTVEASS